MGQIENLKTELQEAQNKIVVIINKIAETILCLPDNPKAKRIASNIVIVNFSDLDSNNWTAEYYNFKWQYWAIAAYISDRQCGPEQLIKRIESIILTGKIPYPYNSAYINFPPQLTKFENVRFNHDNKQSLNPDVIKHLKQLFEAQ